jgi:acetyltransferase-like isoleucine patch superfamily enzyme
MAEAISRGSLQVWAGEAVRRLVQVIVGIALMDMPPLLQLRGLIYRFMFPCGSGLVIGAGCHFLVPHGIAGGSLRIGRDVRISRGVEIDYSGGVEIGDEVWISQNVLIETHDHVPSRRSKMHWRLTRSTLRIEDGAWLGANVVVLGGVRRIGRGAVIGAGAVVTHDVDDWLIVGGVPAKVIGQVTSKAS